MPATCDRPGSALPSVPPPGQKVAVSVPQGALPVIKIAKWNKNMQGVAYWIQRPTDSHFMTAETVVEMYENLCAPAVTCL